MEPAIRLAPRTVVKTAAAVALFGVSMHYLVSGRKEASLGKMMTGAVLALLSLAVLL